MDDRRFDSLTKALAEGKSRRSVLKGLLGLGGAALAGSVVLEGDSEAARRPPGTRTPVPRCPGGQTWNPTTSKCDCPTGKSQCAPNGGPACCNDQVPVGPGYSECCDNACCHYPNDCVGEEMCCPRLPEVGCLNARGSCCTTVCEETPLGAECCSADEFCPGGSTSADLCCHDGATCCGRGTNGNACVDLSIEGNCCTEADCEDPCLVCNLRTHTCDPRCNPETETCCTDQAGPGRCQSGSCCPGLPGCPPDEICCEDARGVASCLADGTFPHCSCQDGESCCCPDDLYSLCCTGPEGECCGVDSVAGVTRHCDTDGHCCEEDTPYFCVSSGTGQDGCCATPCDASGYCCVAPNEICAPGQNCCPVDEGWSCCASGDKECCGGPDGRECDSNGHCCEERTPYYCAGSGTGQEACCATPCCPDGTCGPCSCEADTDCDDDQKCCTQTGLCVPDDSICCTPPLGFQVTPAEVLLCPQCMVCNGEGYCVANPLADGSHCGGLGDDDDDDADDGGLCCNGVCVEGAECCNDDQCEDLDEICCVDAHACGPSCSGGVCCPGGFCSGPLGECCLPPNVGCNGGVCCEGECDGKGDCCPPGNYHCTGGVCCSEPCAGQGGYCPVCSGDSCAVDQVCCSDGCRSGKDYFQCSSDDASCCPQAEACCDVDGCCSGGCYGGDDHHDKCCDSAPDGTEVYCLPADGVPQCCPDRVNQKCCGDLGCCGNSQCNEEANVCCHDDEFACGTTEGNRCCDIIGEKCCDGLCISADQCCPSTDGNCGPTCDEQCQYRCGTLDTGCICSDCPAPQFCNAGGYCDCELGQDCISNEDCCSTNCCNGTCIADGDICPTCAPNCLCGDGVVDPATDGLACNGGFAAGGGVCACGYCAVPLVGCPCGCAGDEECVQCDGAGGCPNINQLGICNGGAGYCSGPSCYSCLDEGDGTCSVDTMCCGDLLCSDAGSCVTCKDDQDSCTLAGDCCSGYCNVTCYTP